MKLVLSENAQELSDKAAEKAGEIIKIALDKKGRSTVMVATGLAHLKFYETLLSQPIDWNKVHFYHLDEYIGISDIHKASFRKYIRDNIENKIGSAKIEYINGENDPQAEILRLNKAANGVEFDLGIVGIGENGHIAFNDPPANFETEQPYIIVTLDETCRLQQVKEGWFESLDEVPPRAITASPRFIMKMKTIVSVVPYLAKAQAIKATLENNEIKNMVPATILKKHKDWSLFVDKESASLLEASFLEAMIKNNK